MKTIREYKCVFGRNLYDTDETNSILEIRLPIYFNFVLPCIMYKSNETPT